MVMTQDSSTCDSQQSCRQHFQIVGTGRALPRHMLTAEEVDARLGMATGWTRKRVGVTTRYECTEPDTLVSMGREAISSALKESELSWRDIDLIIDCSTTRFRPIPCNAAHVQHAFGAEALGIPCFDVQSTCLGFIVALQVANGLFASSHYQHILIVAMEGPLRGVDWRQPESAALLGDGAAAVILRKQKRDVPLLFAMKTFSDHLEDCKIDGGGHYLCPYDYRDELKERFSFRMRGVSVFRTALERLPPMVNTLLALWRQSSSHAQIPIHFIPHQASLQGLEVIRRVLDIPEDNFHVVIGDVGNMAAASIPWVLDWVRSTSVVGAGDNVMLLGTSAGYSQAAMMITL